MGTAVGLLGVGVLLKVLLAMFLLRGASSSPVLQAAVQGNGLLNALVATCVWGIGRHVVQAADGSAAAFVTCACAWGAAYAGLWGSEIRSVLGAAVHAPVASWQDSPRGWSAHDRLQRVLMVALFALPPLAVLTSMPQPGDAVPTTQWRPL